MLYLEINSLDRTADLEHKKFKIQNQLHQRADTLKITIFQGAKPSENQEVRMFRGDVIESAAGAVITLKGYYNTGLNMFYEGQELKVRIGETDEEDVEVLSVDEAALTVTLTATPDAALSDGDVLGAIIFGGNVSRVDQVNVEVLENLEYVVECVDYNHVFNKKVISDTWEDRDSKYIINDFCNTTVNRNQVFDAMNYASDLAIQTAWDETSDGDNPTTDTSAYREGSASGDFSWTFSAGTAIFTETIGSAVDVSSYMGVSTGTPTKGKVGFWYKCLDYTKITSISVKIGSDSSNYKSYNLTPTSNDWAYFVVDMDNPDASAGTADWTVFDWVQFSIVETADSSIQIDGIRIMDNNFFRFYPYVEETTEFDDIRSPQLEPVKLMERLAKTFQYLWYIDYNRYIHFNAEETDDSPISLTDSSDNFSDLSLAVDQSQLGNRIIVRGGEKTSDNITRQAMSGDDALRTWLLKNKFAGLIVKVADGTDNHAAEVGTNTTNIKITGHGVDEGYFLVNTDRDNAVREVLARVDDDNLTVEAIASQTDGDNIDLATVAKDVGIEGLIDEATVDYVYNSNEKSVRATDSESTLLFGQAIAFEYYERVPIQVQYQDGGSVTALKALGIGDGIFDLDPYTDRNIQDVSTAIAIAQAQVSTYSNPVIEGGFDTNYHGIKAGQIIHIEDSVRGVNESYAVQKVSVRPIESQTGDLFRYSVTFGTTLFGIIEFFQKLLATKDSIELNVDDVVETYVTGDETVESSDANSAIAGGGDERATIAETVESSDVNQAVEFDAGTWRFEPNGVGQTLESRFNLADFG